MQHILGTIPHLLMAILITIPFIKNKKGTLIKIIMTFALSCAVVLTPDILKFFGLLAGHSLFFFPVIVGLYSICYQIAIGQMESKSVMVMFSFILIIGHIMLDFFGNGAHLFYPFSEEDLNFSIIDKFDLTLIVYLLILTTVVIKFNLNRQILFVGLLLLVIFSGLSAVSKLQLEKQLSKEYNDEEVELLITYPENAVTWNYQVRTPNRIIVGTADKFRNTIEIDVVTEFQE
ncbi:hypothetical protein [Jeotgalibacillus sp. R-1-5s-1]|uniref:hypothetical protein n=1 Tax=Jeotgalibacillus sp. R-1-5s-1 TaxID=2555897 RepID=UPI00106BBF28|nr:hypothetical protein [Jeotgalibacillus sp. R-1-5s-1]TFD94427.1 hypothetical protein E2491_13400 [Jeotgalibacillus sp. R-1-5s-1]